jgi:hypothetical protein
MKLGNRLQDATGATHLPNLNLKPNLLRSVPLLSHLRTISSPPIEASDQPREGGSTLQEERGGGHEGDESVPLALLTGSIVVVACNFCPLSFVHVSCGANEVARVVSGYFS